MSTLFGIKSSKIIHQQELRPGLLVIEGEYIKEILPYSSEVEFPIQDVKDLVIMPGAIDAHVHVNEPGRTEWEGFTTATKAAVAGGTTTIVDMPLNSMPVTTNVTALNKKIQSAQSQTWCNVGFYGGIIPDNQDEIGPLLNAGVLGIKAFMCPSGLDDFPAVTPHHLRQILPILKNYRRPLLVHAELEDQSTNRPAHSKQYMDYALSRPPQFELQAIEHLINLVVEFNTPIHVVHLATSAALERLKEVRKSWPLSVETCPHYLLFSQQEIGPGQTQFKCAPPIRSQKNSQQLRQGLKNGIIDFITTDHSPAPAELKQLKSGDFMSAWGGIASIQWLLSASWTIISEEQGSVIDLVKLLCHAPAEFLGLDHLMGSISPGLRADLVIWDPEADVFIDEKNTYFKNKISPYINRTLKGKVHQTYVNGQLVFNQGQFGSTHGNIILK